MNEYPIVVEKNQNDIDDLVSGDTNLVDVENLKQKSIELFSKGSFKMIIQIINKNWSKNY